MKNLNTPTLFPNVENIEFNNWLRQYAQNKGWKNSGDFSSHSLRRGGANYLLERGKTYAEIAKWGRWTSFTALVYLEQDRVKNPINQQSQSENIHSEESSPTDSDD